VERLEREVAALRGDADNDGGDEGRAMRNPSSGTPGDRAHDQLRTDPRV